MSKKVNLALIISSLLVIAMIIIIFAFSTQGGQTSVSLSEEIVDKLIGRLGLKNFVENNAWLYEKRNYIFRKILHFTEYAILAVLMFNSLRLKKVRQRKASLFTLFFAFIVAAADEFYQSHIPGRSPRIIDVFIDTSGAVIAILSILFCTKLLAKFKKDGAY
ncbi:MAG: VanZ like family protein [Firmicutes bacterium ADurb.Bin419]|nr:MAG: VanZ like family protein [Firmicutes bacterium ADurb.Bin419]